jgi:hypothetical protein
VPQNLEAAGPADPAGRNAGGPGRAHLAQTLATIALLAVVAAAVTLVLAQSAGALHLGFLGPVG